jgi:hypothetical protein
VPLCLRSSYIPDRQTVLLFPLAWLRDLRFLLRAERLNQHGLICFPVPLSPHHVARGTTSHSTILLTQADLHGSAISYRTATSSIGRASPSLTDILSNCHSYRWTAALLAINTSFGIFAEPFLVGCVLSLAVDVNSTEENENRLRRSIFYLPIFSFVKRLRLRWKASYASLFLRFVLQSNHANVEQFQIQYILTKVKTMNIHVDPSCSEGRRCLSMTRNGGATLPFHLQDKTTKVVCPRRYQSLPTLGDGTN